MKKIKALECNKPIKKVLDIEWQLLKDDLERCITKGFTQDEYYLIKNIINIHLASIYLNIAAKKYREPSKISEIKKSFKDILKLIKGIKQIDKSKLVNVKKKEKQINVPN